VAARRRSSPRATNRSASNLATSKRRPASHPERRTTRPSVGDRSSVNESAAADEVFVFPMAWALRPARCSSVSFLIGEVPRFSWVRSRRAASEPTSQAGRSARNCKSMLSRSRTASRGDASEPAFRAIPSRVPAVIIPTSRAFGGQFFHRSLSERTCVGS
jgi:hypothetical protein